MRRDLDFKPQIVALLLLIAAALYPLQKAAACDANCGTPSPALIIGTDNRMDVASFAISHKISEDDVRSRFHATGALKCGAQSFSAQLTLKNNIITTAAHAFYQICNQQVDLKQCKFITVYENVSREFKIKRLVGAGGPCPTAATRGEDWAVAELSKAVEGIEGYKIIPPPYPLMLKSFEGYPVTHPAAWHVDLCGPNGCPPIVSECSIRDIMHVEAASPIVHMDCDVGFGASGSAQLISVNDVDYMFSISVAKAETANGQAYNKDKVFTQAVPIQGRFLEVLLGL